MIEGLDLLAFDNAATSMVLAPWDMPPSHVTPLLDVFQSRTIKVATGVYCPSLYGGGQGQTTFVSWAGESYEYTPGGDMDMNGGIELVNTSNGTVLRENVFDIGGHKVVGRHPAGLAREKRAAGKQH